MLRNTNLLHRRIANAFSAKSFPANKKTSIIASNPNSKLIKSYHSSKMVENQLIIGGMAILGTALALKYSVQAYNNFEQFYAQKKAEDAKLRAEGKHPEMEAKKAEAEEEKRKKAQQQSKASSASSESANEQPSIFESWFARNFYDGGFEEKMSKREAALVLGVRESASVERIKEAHRRILLLNHPDRGGSAFIAAKVNEAKALLLKGKEGPNSA